ncbi:MAG: branched-chain amino acid ABC transporter permease [Chloroflexi bacterium]|nr:branched-chain amino acid ABC transporter permease [Chloroflexota bacterium]
MGLIDIFTSLVKIIAVLAYVYGLLWVLGKSSRWVKIAGILVAFGIIQLVITVNIGGSPIFNGFDLGLLFQACSMTMVALGLNLIYGFNGQFSLGQYGFYGIGAYTAADITYRWINGDARGLIVVLSGVIIVGLMIFGLRQIIHRYRGIPVLTQFTLYLVGTILAGIVAVYIGRGIAPAINPLLGTNLVPGALAQGIPLQVVFFLAIICAGVFAAETSFLFGLPVLTLGSDYFGIATLGFTIVVNTLMLNSDTILPFPEMKGGRGMIGIPKLTTWFWAFVFLVLVIVVMRNIIRSSSGRTIMSVREDEVAARAMGVDVADTKLISFMVGSLFAGIGGAIYAHYIGFLSPNTFNFLLSFNPLIIVVFGGLGSMSGTIAATFGWTFFLEGLLRNLLGTMGTDAPTWRYVLYPVTLLVVMLIRPQGLLGTTEWGFLKDILIKPRVKPQVAAPGPIAPAESQQGLD